MRGRGGRAVGAWRGRRPRRAGTRCTSRSIRRRRIGRLVYEQLTFEHDPRLPASLAAEGLGGPATAVVHLCRHGDERRPWLVWVHGAGQGQPIDLLFSRARRIQNELGFNIALPVQPGHGVRRNAWPAYPNMDPLANVAGMMRAVSEVRAVVRWLRPQATAIAVSGVSMGSPVAGLVSHLEDGRRRRGVYADLRAQRDDRRPPRPVGPVGPRHHRAVAVRRRGAGGVGRRLPVRRAVAAAASAGSSSAPGTTGWRCASPLLRSTNGGAASCTGTTAAMPGTCSPGVCRRRRSGSLAGSVRKAAADCSGDLLGITDHRSIHASHCACGMRTVGPLIVIAPRMSPAASNTGAESPDAESSRSPAVIA